MELSELQVDVSWRLVLWGGRKTEGHKWSPPTHYVVLTLLLALVNNAVFALLFEARA